MTPRQPSDPISQEIRRLIVHLRGPQGALAYPDRLEVARRLLAGTPDSAALTRASAHVFLLASERRAIEDRAERLAAGQLEFDA